MDNKYTAIILDVRSLVEKWKALRLLGGYTSDFVFAEHLLEQEEDNTRRKLTANDIRQLLFSGSEGMLPGEILDDEVKQELNTDDDKVNPAVLVEVQCGRKMAAKKSPIPDRIKQEATSDDDFDCTDFLSENLEEEEEDRGDDSDFMTNDRKRGRGNDVKKLKCNKCSRRYRSDIGLRNHQRFPCSSKEITTRSKSRGKSARKSVLDCSPVIGELPLVSEEQNVLVESVGPKTSRPKTGVRRDDSKKFKCNNCRRRFRKQSGLDNHKSLGPCVRRNIRPRYKRRFKDLTASEGSEIHACSICDDSFPSRTSMAIHMRVHYNRKCSSCPKVFETKEDRSAHERAEHQGVVHQCEVCKEVFRNITTLQTHSNKHTNNRTFACDECDKAYTTYESLRQHKIKHKGQFTCDQCGKAFLSNFRLKVHAMIHTGEKPYSCDQCVKRYGDPGSLRYHLKTAHEGVKMKPKEKNQSCEHCGKRFSTITKLRDHVNTHTGAKPHVCQVCGAAFASNGTYRTHVAGHTDQALHRCKQCSKSFRSRRKLLAHVTELHAEAIENKLVDLKRPETFQLSREAGQTQHRNHTNAVKDIMYLQFGIWP